VIAIKYIYYDYGGAHSSVLAANLHTGKLKPAIYPTSEEIMSFPYFDKTTPEDFGKIHYIGSDESENDVYVMGTKSTTFGPALNNIAELMGISEDIIFVDTTPGINNTLRLGGWISRSLGNSFLGRPLVFAGSKKAIPYLVNIVNRVKANIS